MGKLKVYKRTLAALTATTMVLLTGCMGGTKETAQKEPEKSNSCHHVTVYFEDQPITFKECEGYDIHTHTDRGYTLYNIEKDGKKILENGGTSLSNSYDVYHDVADEIIDNESVQKAK